MGEELKVGMVVYISYDLKKTQELYSVTEEMKEMIGTKQKIEDIYIDGNGKQLVRICGYSWSAEDVITYEIRKTMTKKSQEFHYDVNQLDI